MGHSRWIGSNRAGKDGDHMARKIVTRGEGIRILAEAKHEMKFSRTTDEASYAFRRACKYQGLVNPHYCGSRSCENCSIQRMYNEQLGKIAFISNILKSMEETS